MIIGQLKSAPARKTRCTCCGELKDPDEFYSYQGCAFRQCKKCIQLKTKQRQMAEREKSCEETIRYLNKIAKGRRARSLFALVEKGSVDAGQFAIIVRKVDFFVPDYEV